MSSLFLVIALAFLFTVDAAGPHSEINEPQRVMPSSHSSPQLVGERADSIHLPGIPSYTSLKSIPRLTAQPPTEDRVPLELHHSSSDGALRVRLSATVQRHGRHRLWHDLRSSVHFLFQ